jgi:energy-converting hydrogenase Eha subunit G
MKIVERIKAPTPKFFKILRSIGLALLAISGTVVAAPIVLPVTVVTVAGYMAVAGSVISAVSQMTVADEVLRKTQENTNKPRDGD